jgi:hypothetical protein
MDLKRTEQIQAIAAKIRALLAKTEENGCSEEEALLAATKAQELMAKYHVNLTETELRAEPMARESRPSQGRIDDSVRNALAMAIAAFADCTCWVSGYRTKATVFAGLESDAQFARWLLDSLASFIDRGAKLAQKDGMDRRSFALGAAHRIAQRLRDEIAKRKAAAAKHYGTGTELMVRTKRDMVSQYLKDVGIKLRSRSSYTQSAGDRDAYSAGASYGNGASFSRPVNGNGSVARIGRS